MISHDLQPLRFRRIICHSAADGCQGRKLCKDAGAGKLQYAATMILHCTTRNVHTHVRYAWPSRSCIDVCVQGYPGDHRCNGAILHPFPGCARNESPTHPSTKDWDLLKETMEPTKMSLPAATLPKYCACDYREHRTALEGASARQWVDNERLQPS